MAAGPVTLFQQIEPMMGQVNIPVRIGDMSVLEGRTAMSRWRRLISVLVFVVLAACGRNSNDQVRSFFTDIAHGDAAQAAARFSPSLHKKFSNDTLYEALNHWSQDIATHGGLTDMTVQGGVITYNELALYDVTLHYRDGKQKTLKTTLIRTDGVWYINTAL